MKIFFFSYNGRICLSYSSHYLAHKRWHLFIWNITRQVKLSVASVILNSLTGMSRSGRDVLYRLHSHLHFFWKSESGKLLWPLSQSRKKKIRGNSTRISGIYWQRCYGTLNLNLESPLELTISWIVLVSVSDILVYASIKIIGWYYFYALTYGVIICLAISIKYFTLFLADWGPLCVL